MKKIIFLLTILLISSFGSYQKKNLKPINDWDKMSLNGRVKSVTEEQCKLVKSLNGDNKICKVKLKIIFNSNGYRVEEQLLEFEQLREKKIFIYNDSNLLIKTQCLGYYYLFHYDINRFLVEEKVYRANDIEDSRYIYKYDEQGRKIQMDGYNMKTGGNHFIKEIYTYDNFGNLVKESREHATGNSYTEYYYKYNKYGKVIEKTTNTTYEKLGKNFSFIQYKYDNQKNVIQEISNHDGYKTKTDIKVDKSGNWIKRNISESPNVFLITDRIIEYF